MLNETTIKTIFPLPDIEKHLTKLRGAKVLYKLDFQSNYWQLSLEGDAKE